MWRERYPPQDYFQYPALQYLQAMVVKLVELDELVELDVLPFSSVVEFLGLFLTLETME